jgi:hypothetical protein
MQRNSSMKLLPILAVINAGLAVVSALLGAAAFTAAPVLFLALVPLAALFSHKNQTVAALLVVASAVAAWIISPVQILEFQSAAPVVWVAWVSVWSVAVLYLSRRKLRTAFLAARGRGVTGA